MYIPKEKGAFWSRVKVLLHPTYPQWLVGPGMEAVKQLSQSPGALNAKIGELTAKKRAEATPAFPSWCLDGNTIDAGNPPVHTIFSLLQIQMFNIQ